MLFLTEMKITQVCLTLAKRVVKGAISWYNNTKYYAVNQPMGIDESEK